MVLLRDVGRDANDVALQRGLGGADRQPADLLRGGDVSVEQRRGQVADRDVVEAVTAFIGGQERGGVDVEGQQVSDGVLILGTIQTPQRLRAARIRPRGGGLVERCFQPREQGPAIVHRGLRHAGRRHRARAKFAHDLLPDLGAGTRIGDVGLVQHQAGGLELLVVAGDAVAIEHLTLARPRSRRAASRAVFGWPAAGGAVCEDALACRPRATVTANPVSPIVAIVLFAKAIGVLFFILGIVLVTDCFKQTATGVSTSRVRQCPGQGPTVPQGSLGPTADPVKGRQICVQKPAKQRSPKPSKSSLSASKSPE